MSDNELQPVPLMAPLRAFNEQENEITSEVARVLKSGMWVYGPEGKAFEDEFAKYLSAKRAVTVNSGTDALLLSLQAMGVGPGTEVITPAYSFFASASVVSLLGATPVFCDVDDRTFNIDPDAVAAAVTSKTVGMIPVHLYGLPADMPMLRDVAERSDIFILEDACQAVGAKIDGQAVGTFGNLSGFSFYPTKNLAGCGEGGAITGTDDEALEVVSKLRMHGETQRYHHSLLGRNSRLDEVQSVILRIKLRKLAEWTKRRQEIASKYTDAWADLPLRVPYVPDGYEHVYHLYVIQSKDRDRLRDFLNEKKIGNGVYYPVPLPNLEVFSGLKYEKGDFPVAEKLVRDVLALPMFPHMTDEEVERVISAILEFHGQ